MEKTADVTENTESSVIISNNRMFINLNLAMRKQINQQYGTLSRGQLAGLLKNVNVGPPCGGAVDKELPVNEKGQRVRSLLREGVHLLGSN